MHFRISVIIKSQCAPGSDLTYTSMNSRSIKENDSVNDKALPIAHKVVKLLLQLPFSLQMPFH